jgi:hypothetical protein
MPIKINLLAEAQAAEQLRRKDPVKRAIWIGVLVVAGMLVWAGILYSEGFIVKSNQRQLERAWKDSEKRFLELSEAHKQVQALNQKILALDRYTTNRFLWGSALNAFQQTIPSAMSDKIQYVRLHGFHEYQVTEAVPPRKVGKVTQPGKPAASRERITVIIDARDFGNPADQNYDRFKNAIVSVPFFKETLPADGILLKSVSPPLRDPIEQRDYIQFTLECKFPPAIRNE